MPYPKPLSEKSLETRYSASGLTDAARSFLHTLFAACANLYGAISVRDVWDIYQQLQNVPKLRKKDLLAFSSIVRREIQPYCIFEIEELYKDEPHNEQYRHIVHRDLVGSGYGKFYSFYSLMEQSHNKPFCIPEDFLSYASPSPIAEEAALLSFLSELRSVTDMCEPKYARPVPNDHKGKTLGEYSFLNTDERFELEWLQKRSSALEIFQKDVSGTEAEKIVRQYKQRDYIGRISPSESLRYLLDELAETGVRLSEAQLEKLTELTKEFHNNSRLWCTAGWKPRELARMYRRSGPPSISFGAGMLQAFADGTLNKEEVVEKLRSMGLNVTE